MEPLISERERKRERERENLCKDVKNKVKDNRKSEKMNKFEIDSKFF